MSLYVLMRILESAPRRYEPGMRLLTLGRLDRAYDRLANHISPEQTVLDIGCGTGALALRAAKRGAKVKGMDLSSEMLEIAAQRVHAAGLDKSVELAEMGVAELDSEPAHYYDVATCGLVFSELSTDELRFTLRQLARILHPGGLLLVADETRPRGAAKRLLHALLRAPLVALAWLITQQTTHAVAGFERQLTDAGFVIAEMRCNWLGSFCECVAQAPKGEGA